MGNIKAFIAYSAPIFASGLSQVLSSDKRIEVVGQVYSGKDVIDKIEMLNPDIVIMDAQLPEHGGIQVLEVLQEQYPNIKAIIITPPDNVEVLLDSALNAGAKGFLPYTITPAELIKGVIETADGGATISPTLISLILDKLVEKRQEKPEVEIVLSIRERGYGTGG